MRLCVDVRAPDLERLHLSATCRAEHIGIGTEILLGQIVNSHARTVSLELANHGFYVYHHSAVGDNLERILRSFRLAASRSNVVIVTGGLGPTADDLTREALAEFLNRPLELSPEALADIESYFANRDRPMPEENKKQAYGVSGGVLLPNPNGTAPGQYVEAEGVHYFLLPGPPLEMLPMLHAQVLPRLKDAFPTVGVLTSRVLHLCGIGESSVDEQIPDLLEGDNPTVAPLAGEGEMLLRITATDATEELAKARIAPVEDKLLALFGPYVYGYDDDTLPVAVGRRLEQAGATLAVAESCTGGLVASLLTAIPGSSAYFWGGVVAYQNEVKEHVLGVAAETLKTQGAVSAQTAREMAEGVRQRLGTTFGISLTGVAGPGGGTPEKPVGLVYCAVASNQGTEAFELRLRGSREQIRLRAAKQVLWRLCNALKQTETDVPGV